MPNALQIPIKAGHEFIVSVDDKYAKACDDKVLYMDYVRALIQLVGTLPSEIFP